MSDEKAKGLGITKHDDGTITIEFPHPWRPHPFIFLNFAYDGTGFTYLKKGGKIHLTSIRCHPEQWKAYIREWGGNCPENVKRAVEVFEKYMRECK